MDVTSDDALGEGMRGAAYFCGDRPVMAQSGPRIRAGSWYDRLDMKHPISVSIKPAAAQNHPVIRVAKEARLRVAL